MRAALALYDGTGDARWFIAAREAANFTETRSYSWNWPIKNAPQYAYAGTRGNSLIATGHCGADISLSFDSYNFYRLHLLADDPTNHYLRFALDIENNTKLTTQLTGVPTQQFGFGKAVGEHRTSPRARKRSEAHERLTTLFHQPGDDEGVFRSSRKAHERPCGLETYIKNNSESLSY